MKTSAVAFNAAPGSGPVSRRDALLLFSTAVCGLVAPAAAMAAVAAVDEANAPKKIRKGARGSKDAKGYQLCMSQCLYDCTTPRAGLAKERSQCRVECKDECAVSREQL